MTLPTLLARLAKDAWTRAWHPDYGTTAMQSADQQLFLEINGQEWYLSEFTDSDVAGVAVGRYETVDEGDSLREVPEAIRCAELGIARLVEDDSVYEYAEQKGAGMREDGE